MWVVFVVFIVLILLGMIKILKFKGSILVGNVFMYLFFVVIGSKVNFFGLLEVFVYIMFGLVVVFVYVILFIGFVKLFKFDLFICEVGSIVNIGGVIIVLMIVGVYNFVLILVGVFMGFLGNIIGIYCVFMVI